MKNPMTKVLKFRTAPRILENRHLVISSSLFNKHLSLRVYLLCIAVR